MMLARIELALDMHQPEEQYGFRKEHRIEEHLLTANLVVDKLLAVSTPIWIMSLDLSKAFDRVSWDRRWVALQVNQHREPLLNCHVSLRLRLKFFDINQFPAMLFGLTTVPLSAAQLSKLDIVTKKCYIQLLVGFLLSMVTGMIRCQKRIKNCRRHIEFIQRNHGLRGFRGAKFRFAAKIACKANHWPVPCSRWQPGHFNEKNWSNLHAHGQPIRAPVIGGTYLICTQLYKQEGKRHLRLQSLTSAQLNEVLREMEPKCRILRQYLPVIHLQKSHEGWKFGNPVASRTSRCMTSIRHPPQYPLDPRIMWHWNKMYWQFPIISQGPVVAPKLHTMFQCDWLHFSISIMTNIMLRAWPINVRRSPVEICDKQRLIDVGPVLGQYGVRSQKTPQDSQLHQNTSAGLSQARSRHRGYSYWQRRLSSSFQPSQHRGCIQAICVHRTRFSLAIWYPSVSTNAMGVELC